LHRHFFPMKKLLLSTAYLPAIEYISLISKASQILIEKEENYIKQSYRNRCYILSSHGRQLLSVPVLLGSIHKTPVREIRIDYSKRWQQVHLRALTSAYSSSPYFQFYFESIEKIISSNFDLLIDLNSELLALILTILKINVNLRYTDRFEPSMSAEYDYRYALSPKIQSHFLVKKYLQVFDNSNGFVQNLSVLDLIFNVGPEAINFF